MIDIYYSLPAIEDDAHAASRFVEIVCPACHTTSHKIRVGDLLEQRTFDDVHRRCYINAVPNGRA
jgi:hypothetical protein